MTASLTIVKRPVKHCSPALLLGSRAEFAKSTLFAANAAKKVMMEAMNLMLIETETWMWTDVFIYSLYSMKLVMRRQRRCELVGEWPGFRVGNLGGEYGLAATLSLQISQSLEGQ